MVYRSNDNLAKDADDTIVYFRYSCKTSALSCLNTRHITDDWREMGYYLADIKGAKTSDTSEVVATVSGTRVTPWVMGEKSR